MGFDCNKGFVVHFVNHDGTGVPHPNVSSRVPSDGNVSSKQRDLCGPSSTARTPVAALPEFRGGVG